MIYTTMIILKKIEKRQLQISQRTEEILWRFNNTKIQTTVQHEVQVWIHNFVIFVLQLLVHPNY